MPADRAVIVPCPPDGCVLLVVRHGEDRCGFVMVDIASLCRSPDSAWSALRRAWIRLAESLREERASDRLAGTDIEVVR